MVRSDESDKLGQSLPVCRQHQSLGQCERVHTA